MNNLYQCEMWDYTSANKDFYEEVSSDPNSQEWSQIISALLRGSGLSATELSRYLDYDGVPAQERLMDITPLRDHIEALVIGKVTKPKKSIVDRLIKLTSMYVQEDKLKRIF